MTQIRIVIVEVGSEPPWPDLPGDDVLTGEIERAAVIQSGMVSGATSVAFAIPTTAGYVVAEASAAVLRALLAAIDGAEARWEGR